VQTQSMEQRGEGVGSNIRWNIVPIRHDVLFVFSSVTISHSRVGKAVPPEPLMVVQWDSLVVETRVIL
jgi:hypothetical protein